MAPALAQNAAPRRPGRAKRQTAGQATDGANTVTVLVTNRVKADLVELQAADSGSAKVEKSARCAESRQTGLGILPRNSNCQVDLHGAFADGQSMDAQTSKSAPKRR